MAPGLVGCQTLPCGEALGHWCMGSGLVAAGYRAQGHPGFSVGTLVGEALSCGQYLSSGMQNWVLWSLASGSKGSSFVAHWWVEPVPDTASFRFWGVLKLLSAH